MLPFLTESFGNPSSAHGYGRVARAGLDEAHERVARRLNAEGREIVFTSGGTEANNLAIRGAVAARRPRGNHVVTVATEHHAVLDTCQALERDGWTAHGRLNVIVRNGVVELWGLVDSEEGRRAIRIAVENVPGVAAVKDNMGRIRPWLWGA